MTKFDLIKRLKRLREDVESEMEKVSNDDCTTKSDKDSRFWLEATVIIHSNFCDILDLYKLY